MTKETLKQLYLTDPLGVSNIAYWKQEDFLENQEVRYEVNGDYHHLSILRDNAMFFYYSWQEKDGKIIQNTHDSIWTQEKLDDLDFYMLNQVQKDIIKPKGEYETSRPLLHKTFHDKTLPSGCQFVPFDYEKDMLQAAELINKVYGYSYDERSLIKYTECQAFDSDLWLWIEVDGKKAALGIGDFHKGVKEGTLDWIQVDPDFHGRGLGEVLVAELVNRIDLKGGHCRVTGIADAFYEKCGFEKGPVWYVYKNR